MLKNRQIKRIAKIAEKILKKSYRNSAYFTIEKITVFLGDDYVELYNPTPYPINLTGYSLSEHKDFEKSSY